jgi:hypothetical protein
MLFKTIENSSATILLGKIAILPRVISTPSQRSLRTIAENGAQCFP